MLVNNPQDIISTQANVQLITRVSVFIGDVPCIQTGHSTPKIVVCYNFVSFQNVIRFARYILVIM